MALSRPDTGQSSTFIQQVDVNGLDRFYFKSRQPFMGSGDGVELRAQPNECDPNSIEVRFDSVQIGWVPRAQNKDLARRLRNGQTLKAVVTCASAGTLRLAVYVLRETTPKPLARVTLNAGNMAHLRARMREFPTLTPFELATSMSRTSVSVLDPEDNTTLAWFRKSEVTPTLDWDQCVVVRAPDGGYDLYLKGQTPAEPPTSEFYTAPLAISAATIQTTNKETTVKNLAANLLDTNKSAAAQAGFLEAGRIANNQLVRVSSKALPLMVRGYADTPIGKLVLANIAQLAAGHLRAGDPTLARLTNAMTVAAYQELIQTFDIEGWLNQALESPEMKRAMSKLGEAPTADSQRPGAVTPLD